MKTIIEQLTEAGFSNIKLDPYGADISFINNDGENVGLMVFPELRYKKEALVAIKCKHISMYDKWYCLSSYDGYMKVNDVIGKEFCILKGAEFSKFCGTDGD